MRGHDAAAGDHFVHPSNSGFKIVAKGGAQTGITTDLTGAVVLISTHPIGETSGIISTGTLSGSSVDGAGFANTNEVSTLAGWTDTLSVAPTGFTLASGESLATTGTVKSSGAVTLGVSGAGNTLSLGAVVQGTTVTLLSQGSISQSAGTISATNLVARTRAAIAGTGSITLGDANAATNVTLTDLEFGRDTPLDASGGISYTSGVAFTIVGQSGGGVGHLETGIGTSGTVTSRRAAARSARPVSSRRRP